MVTTVAGATAAAVPALTRLSLWTCRFVNVTASPVTLKVFRVASGGTAVDQYLAVETVTIPVASLNNPYFAWDPGFTLSPGDAIWAVAGSASAITVSGDGGISN